MPKARPPQTKPAPAMTVVPPGSPSAMGWVHREGALAQAGQGTQCIHAGSAPDPAYGAVTPPVYQTSTFAYLDVTTSAGFEYTRSSNPTRACLEAAITLLEGGSSAVCTSSGMSAALVALSLLEHGSHLLCPWDSYGGTYRTLEHVKRTSGLEVTYLDMGDLDAVAKALRPNTRMIWAETPSNPLLRLSDLAALARIAKGADALLVADNSFLSPLFQRPFAWGADLVMHSTSKFLNGHSDLIGGALVAAPGQPELGARLATLNKTLGTSQSPHDCSLVLRGLKTLHLRMRAHETNAGAVAEFLAGHPDVATVNYPGLPSHPQHDLAKRQQLGFGAVLSFELRDAKTATRDRLLRSLKWFTLAESLGGVESLVNVPATMSHASMTPEVRERVGIRDGLIRLSVGIEDREDLLEDLRVALECAANG
jgi:cystathionine gamma-synthase